MKVERLERSAAALGRWWSGGAPVDSSKQTMALAAAALYATGATVVAGCLGLRDATMVLPAVLGVVLAAYATATFLFAAGRRLPWWMFHALTLGGTILITILVHFAGNLGDAFGFFYIWVLIYVFYFFAPRWALGHTAVLGLAAAVALLAPRAGAGPAPGAEWVTAMATGIASGIVIAQLVSRISILARSDYLTGLPNRRAWDEVIAAAGERGRPDGAVAIIDLDHFKVFNEEYGARRGDLHLRAVADVWRSTLPPSARLARYGGDEFAVYVAHSDGAGMEDLVERLRSVTPAGQGISAGIAHRAGGEPIEATMARAEAALLDAKREGRGISVVSGGGRRRETVESDRWAAEVVRVLREGAVTPYFQRMIRLSDRSVVGHEALSRPSGLRAGASVEGFFAAAQFMARMTELDLLCHRSAIRRAAELQLPGLLFLNVSVATVFETAALTEALRRDLVEHAFDPSRVVLELTERESITNLPRLRAACAELHAAGFKLALDDVGDGRSTLAALAGVVPDFIKVAGELIQADEPAQRAALRAMIGFARDTGATVVAEGVEHQRTAERLLAAGVQVAQGYLFGAPSNVFGAEATAAEGETDIRSA